MDYSIKLNSILSKKWSKTPKGQALDGRPQAAKIQAMTDNELLEKLSSFNLKLDKTELEKLCDQALSAEDITKSLLKDRVVENPQHDLTAEWTWYCLTELWARWFPDKPSFESIDTNMETGYQLLTFGDEAAACSHWLSALSEVWAIIDKENIKSIEEFDRQFGSRFFLHNWLQDLEMELGNAGLKKPSFYEARITLCQTILEKFPSSTTGQRHDLTTGNWKRALADSYFALGQTEKADALFQEWLKNDPQWGWGWIGWADCTAFGHSPTRNLAKSEKILQDGLAVTDVRNRLELMERLADVFTDQGKTAQAKQLLEQAAAEISVLNEQLRRSSGHIPQHKDMLNAFSQPAMNMHNKPRQTTVAHQTQTVGKKEPCPCGSGKKYKRCCGSGL